MKGKKASMKRWILCMALSVILAIFASYIKQFDLKAPQAFQYLARDRNVSYDVEKFESNGFDVIGNRLISTTDDSSIVTSVMKDGKTTFIYDIQINLKKTLEEDVFVTVYYASAEGGFDGEHFVKCNLSAGETSVDAVLKQQAAFIRIDLGDQSGQAFELDSIISNTNSLFSDADVWILALLFWFVFAFLFLHVLLDIKTMYAHIYKWRFAIAALVILMGVILDLNGSSIASWSDIVNVEDTNIVLGEKREIRSDEWAVLTPMAIAQKMDKNPFSWFNSIIRGTKTDVFIVYAQPVLHIFSIMFRPFLNGYLLFGASRGLAFFWWARLVCLWMAYFELFMMMTKGKKSVSMMGAMMIAFAPVVQWWFAVNGLVEMLFFSALSVLMLDKYMLTENRMLRLLYLFIIYICAGGYLLVFYPAWMVPLAYILLCMIIWVFIKNRKFCKINWKDILSIVGVLALFAGSMYYIFSNSWEAVDLELNTAYPGKRVSLGGDMGLQFFKEWGNLWFKKYKDGIPLNACESAVVFDLMPIGFLLSIYTQIKNKKKDILAILLMIVAIFFGIYTIWGVPELIAKISFLSYSLAHRAFIAIGFINVILLVRALAAYRQNLSKAATLGLALIYTITVILTSRLAYVGYLDEYRCVGIALLSFSACVFILQWNSLKKAAVCWICLICAMMGALVNPVQRGLAGVTDSNLAKAIWEIEEEESGLWLADNRLMLGNYLIMQGASSLSSTHTYPNLEFWKQLDPQGENNEIYNRYAHMIMTVHEDADEIVEKMYLKPENPDVVYLELIPEELKQLNVNYILSENKMLDVYSNDEVTIEKLRYADGYYIYRVQ